MCDNIFERFYEISMLNLLFSPRHPIPGSFYVHWVKENKFLGRGAGAVCNSVIDIFFLMNLIFFRGEVYLVLWATSRTYMYKA